MADPVSSIKNLGPASDAAFARAGIYTAEEIRELGADAAYARLLAAGSRPHFILSLIHISDPTRPTT